MNINSFLSTRQEEKLLTIFRQSIDAIASEYNEMKGVDTSISTHNLYIR